jgi:hypothetical protein
MTHRIVVNVETGVTTQVEYTPEEQAIHDAAVAAQQAEAEAEAQALAEAQAQQVVQTPEPADNPPQGETP